MSFVIKYFVKFDATTLITTFLVSTKMRQNIFTYISVCRFVLPSILHFPLKTCTFWCIFTNLLLTVTLQYLTYFFDIVFKSLLLHPSTRETKRFKSGACTFKTLHWNFFQKFTFESAFFGCLIGDDRQNAKQKRWCYRRSCKHASVDGAIGTIPSPTQKSANARETTKALVSIRSHRLLQTRIIINPFLVMVTMERDQPSIRKPGCHSCYRTCACFSCSLSWTRRMYHSSKYHVLNGDKHY